MLRIRRRRTNSQAKFGSGAGNLRKPMRSSRRDRVGPAIGAGMVGTGTSGRVRVDEQDRGGGFPRAYQLNPKIAI